MGGDVLEAVELLVHLVHLVPGRRWLLDAIHLEQPLHRARGHRPPEPLQILDDVTALAGVDQSGEVVFEAHPPPSAPAIGVGVRVGESVHVRHELGRHPAAGGAQCGDVVEQSVLGVGGQVHQQTLGDPCGSRVSVEAAVHQGRGPVVTQVDADGADRRRRVDTQSGQGGGFELDHSGLVEIEQDCAGRPGQSVPPGVEARGQDDHLTDAGVGRGQHDIVEVAGPDRHPEGHPVLVGIPGGIVQDAQEVIVADGADQRFGPWVVDHPQTGGQRPRRRDGGGGGTDPGCQVPGITVVPVAEGFDHS